MRKVKLLSFQDFHLQNFKPNYSADFLNQKL